jgi:hypothetical protein
VFARRLRLRRLLLLAVRRRLRLYLIVSVARVDLASSVVCLPSRGSSQCFTSDPLATLTYLDGCLSASATRCQRCLVPTDLNDCGGWHLATQPFVLTSLASSTRLVTPFVNLLASFQVIVHGKQLLIHLIVLHQPHILNASQILQRIGLKDLLNCALFLFDLSSQRFSFFFQSIFLLGYSIGNTSH